MEQLVRALGRFQPDRKTFEILAVIMVLVTAVLIYGFKEDYQTIPLEEEGGVEMAEQKSAKDEEALYVDIDGAVRAPGVYRLSQGARVFEAIDKAGGLKKKADTSTINLAEKVKDGQKINVPAKGGSRNTGAASSADSSGAASSGLSTGGIADGGRININSATSEELQQINGIGPATARKIIDYRNANGAFKNTEELKNVNGIGDKTFEKMREMVTV